jgi:multidrug efflux pump subunit AcrB
VVNLEPDADPAAARDRIEAGLAERLPGTRILVQRFAYGESVPGTLGVRLSATDPAAAVAAAREVHGLFAAAGLRDLVDELPSATPRLRVAVDDDRAAALGIDRARIHAALALHGDGLDAGALATADGPLPIRVRDPSGEPAALLRLPVGDGVVLGQVASVAWTAGLDHVRERDLRPVCAVSGRLPGTAATTLLERFRPELDRIAAAHGADWQVVGEIQESDEANQALLDWIPLTAFLLVAVFLWQFGSWRKVVLVVAGIPFTLIGVALGLHLLAAPFDFMAGLGLLALAGIIVNNAVLLLERIDEELAAGTPPAEAVVKACLLRIRPILMTKLTCILGLVPLMLFGGPLWYGLAVVIAGGLALGTLVTIGLIPVLYACLFRVPKP